MQTDNSQATPPELVTPTGAQVPETTTEKVSSQQEPQTETPLTPELVRQWAREEATRIAQSQVAKGENRIQALIKERFDALDKTKDTLKLTEAQVAQAKQNIVTEAYSTEEVEPQTTQPTSTPDVDQAIQYLNEQIADVFEQLGTTVTKNDPEFKALQEAVDKSWNDPKGLAKILLTASTAAAAKAARLQKNTRNAPARIVGGGSEHTPTTPSLTPSEKLSKGLKAGGWNNQPPPRSRET